MNGFVHLCGNTSKCPAADGCTTLSGDECVVRHQVEQTLQKYFGFLSFKPGQLEAVLPVLHGRDVFVRIATGGGKSICMFLPVLTISSSAIGIIVSPLIGLMDQQVEQLASKGVTAIRISGPSQLKDVARGLYRFVFVSPELIQLSEWRDALSGSIMKSKLAMVAIDEAHCISEWGHDFRTAFTKIGALRALTSVPFMAVTASAPNNVEVEITQSLHMTTPVIVSCNLDRPNIYLSTSRIKSVNRDLESLIKNLNSASPAKTIVYAHTKDAAWKLYHMLQKFVLNKTRVAFYHADLTHETKSYTYQNFLSTSSTIKCLVATIAFGMGMDIQDVEAVVVYGTPSSVTQLYQLFGRAGRNGSKAQAHLFYNNKKKAVNKEVQKFYDPKATPQVCRRKILLEGVGGEYSGGLNFCCDVCSSSGSPIDLTMDFSKSGTTVTKPRRKIVRKVTKDKQESLRMRLLAERDTYDNRFSMIGSSFLCPDSTVVEVCAQAKFVDTIDDIRLFGIRPELKKRFYNTILDVCDCTVSKSKRSRLA